MYNKIVQCSIEGKLQHLSPVLNFTFNSITEKCTFPTQAQETHITLILKNNKDLAQWASCYFT